MSISRCFAENVLTFPMKNRHITPLKRPWNLGAKRTTFLFRKAQRCAFCWRCSAPLWRSRSVKRGRGRRGAHLSLSLSLSQKACMFVSVCVSPSLCARVCFFLLFCWQLYSMGEFNPIVEHGYQNPRLLHGFIGIEDLQLVNGTLVGSR